MKHADELLAEIASLTRKIETDYPELYPFLDENPITIPNIKHPKLDTKDLENYLETLKDQIKKFNKEHQ